MLIPFRIAEEGLICFAHETESSYLLNLDIPRVSKDDIQVEFSGNHVTVSAERKHETNIKEAIPHRTENYLR